MGFDPLSRERLMAYLLGELSPPELAEIDRRVLEDEAFADLLEEARNDLLDAYTLGALPEADRERAQRALNLSPAGRGREVDFSRTLSQALVRASATRATGRRRDDPNRRPRSRWTPLWTTTLAACLVAALGVWIARRAALPGSRFGELRASLPARAEVAMGGSGARGSRAAFVLLLQSAVLRGESAGQTVRLPQALPALETQIIVPDAAGRYEVRVRSAAGESTYRGLAPQSAGGESFVRFSIPRDRLSSGTYDFLLLQLTPGSPRQVRRYTVHLIAP